MNRRVAELREQCIQLRPEVSAERAELITRFYGEARPVSVPVFRALAFKYLLENKTVYIGPGELIVGERGPAPKAVPTYPELCCHSLADLDVLHSRERVAYAVPEQVRQAYRDTIIPFWQGRSMRDLIFAAMTDPWKEAYAAGVFTEFMEQRAPGHTVADDKIYRRGFLGVKRQIEESLEALDYFRNPEAYAEEQQLQAMSICCDAIIGFAERHADLARELARTAPNPTRRGELLQIAEVCSRVPAHPPRDFHEALQAYWFVHLGVITELNTWDAFSPGRLDQHLWPFYEKGLAEGRLTAEHARELLQCFWIKFMNHPAPPKVGVTAAESSTYTDFANIGLGGLTATGADGVNDVTYLLLDVIEELRLVQPSTNIQLSARNPDRFLKRALTIVRQGWGQPSLFNADVIVQELLRQGKKVEDARGGGASGCVEAGAFGKEANILTGYLNLPKILELALNDGVDSRTGRRIGRQTGAIESFSDVGEVLLAFAAQLNHFVDVKIRGNNAIDSLYAGHMPAPFLSMLIDDCLIRAKDYNDGGARYNSSYIQGVGIGTVADSLAAIEHAVFDAELCKATELKEALHADFRGHERIQVILRDNAPKYGNDDPRADTAMLRVFETLFRAVDGRPNPRGGAHRINLLPTTCHVYFGSVTGASADGRNAGQPLSEGISPVQGADRKGPTAVLLSAAKMDHARTGGTLLNLKFSPATLETQEGIDRLAHLVRAYFKLGGHHLQFNVVTAETLREAQLHPESHRDLIVRVAGYSDYFHDLNPALQDEIIARTEHAGF
ncbi:MAG TPA: trans-4-hydroxy-L-proline dehydratase [Bacillota bacterium]|nr:trans-4-hydroxy-L-proline dehydratase [Bacillota bacterium]